MALVVEEPLATIDVRLSATAIPLAGSAVSMTGSCAVSDAVLSVAVTVALVSVPAGVELVIVKVHTWSVGVVVLAAHEGVPSVTGPLAEKATESPAPPVTVAISVRDDAPSATRLGCGGEKLIFVPAAWAVPASAHPPKIAARSTARIATIVRFLLIWSFTPFALTLFDPAARPNSVQSGLAARTAAATAAGLITPKSGTRAAQPPFACPTQLALPIHLLIPPHLPLFSGMAP